MSEVFPISCISCRRKKIKCNKLKPCNQCLKRSIVCEFPSTFRNIQINEEKLDSPPKQRTMISDTFHEEIELLRRDKYHLWQDNMKLVHKNQQLAATLTKVNRNTTRSSSKTQQDKPTQEEEGDCKSDKDCIQINGETSELGDKYYGPQSSSFMMEQLKSYNEEVPAPSKKRKNQNLLVDMGSDSKSSNNSFDSDLIEQSLLKKDLPFLLRVDADMSADSDTNEDLNKANKDIIRKLVDLFFECDAYYKTFISKTSVIYFLDQHDQIKDKEWENDDDLLLLDMILILTLQKITPKQYTELKLLDGASSKNYNKQKNHLTKTILLNQFEKLRHNLINESILTVQSYLLCTEWYFIEQKFEECWSMLFHSCSISYAIGLHVTGRVKNETGGIEGNEIARYKCWFALKYFCCQICSILGRPSPISVQVNQLVLRSSRKSIPNDIDQKRTQILLKIGVSECLRLSNLMLIENFMLDFTFQNLTALDVNFEREIGLLEWFLDSSDTNDEYQAQINYDDEEEIPMEIDRFNVVSDLIILYVNRAKLFEPFVNKFAHIKTEHDAIIKRMTTSIFKYLDLIDLYLVSFVNKYTESYFDENMNYEVKFGKVFRTMYPFLSSSIYQGIVVIFTFLHYEFKQLIHLDSSSVSFLNDLEHKLNRLIIIDRTLSKQLKNTTKLWSNNTHYLMDYILSTISLVRDKRNKATSAVEDTDTNIPIPGGSDTNELNNFYVDLNDPFWLTNPDNLPFYLSSPSDDGSVISIKQQIPQRNPPPSSEALIQNPIQNQPQTSEIFQVNALSNPLYGNIWDPSRVVQPQDGPSQRQISQPNQQTDMAMSNPYNFNANAGNPIGYAAAGSSQVFDRPHTIPLHSNLERKPTKRSKTISSSTYRLSNPPK
ncbi:uncharacterized protein PRCAT00005661001 [Priceomyces carsonii]|uniref:uncharacterized protein n=1 Tax=Priceomyces carsonii TaxID=28549 RepID=UPI002EDA39A1|nr:unnamed protein product [Priceomyces carsonii]